MPKISNICLNYGEANPGNEAHEETQFELSLVTDVPPALRVQANGTNQIRLLQLQKFSCIPSLHEECRCGWITANGQWLLVGPDQIRRETSLPELAA